MRKIPTIFKRNQDNMREILNEPNPDCVWVFAGEGVATRKYDGTCCKIDVDGFWKRREVKKITLQDRLLAEAVDPRCSRFGVTVYPQDQGFVAVANVCLSINEDDSGHCFDITIHLLSQYPRAVPIVTTEDAEVKEFHVNGDGSLGLGEPSEVDRLFRRDPTLAGLIDNLVLPFFAKYLYWKETGVDLGLRHGGDGILDHYRERLGAGLSARAVFDLLRGQYFRKINPNRRCPCGSGVKYKKCHRPKVLKLQLAKDPRLQVEELIHLQYLIDGEAEEVVENNTKHNSFSILSILKKWIS